MKNKSKIEKDKWIVVTGAAGFIGSCMLTHLNLLYKDFSKILLVDDIADSSRWHNLLGKRFARFLSSKDLINWLKENSDEVQAIIHLGACSDTLVTDGNFVMENNYQFTIKLAEWALNQDVRFIYASSAATYGDGSQGFCDDHAKIRDLRPLNLYGFSKQLFDLWALEQGVLDQIVGLKYFNVFGPNEYEKGRMASMVLKMTPDVISKGRISLFKSNDPKHFADGGQMRDFIYVKDAVAMTARFLETKEGGIFNIGTGTPTTWNALAGAIFTALGKEILIDYIDMPHELSRQYQNYTCAPMDKFANLFGKDFLTYTALEGVEEYVKEYIVKSNKRW